MSNNFAKKDSECIDISSSDEYHLDDFMECKNLTDERDNKDRQTSISNKRFYGLVDESTDEDVDDITKHYQYNGNLVDDEANKDGKDEDVGHLDDFSDSYTTFNENTNDYDYSDSFINDEPLSDEDTENDSNIDK